MTDTENALFTVRLPVGTKTVPFDEATRWIAEAKNPPPESLDEYGRELLGADWLREESELKAAVRRGEVEVLDSSYHTMPPPFSSPKLEKAVLTVKAFRQYVEGIKGAVETDDELLTGNEPTLNGVKLSQIYADQMAHRHAANCFDIVEAAKAIAVQLGHDMGNEEKLRDDMAQAAFEGKLTVRSPRGHDQYAPTLPPATTYGFDCLVTPDDVNEWATARRFLWRWKVQAPEQNTATPATVEAVSATLALPKQRTQESRILELLRKQGYDPLNLPKRTPGKRGTKAEIRLLAMLEPKLFSEKSFDTAWQRLRDDDDLIES